MRTTAAAVAVGAMALIGGASPAGAATVPLSGSWRQVINCVPTSYNPLTGEIRCIGSSAWTGTWSGTTNYTQGTARAGYHFNVIAAAESELKVGDAVRVLRVPIGHVSGIVALRHRVSSERVELIEIVLKPRFPALSVGTRINVCLASAQGAYVEVMPGPPGLPLASGTTFPLSSTTTRRRC